MKFAKQEYSDKRPLELRLLQLKPQTIFQRGSVLPSLLIKSLQRTTYVIYLDYGTDLRFYFFDIGGRSLGASTFPKSEKMMSEMHGKATTILKLPKPDPSAGLDLETIHVRDHFHALCTRVCQKYGLSMADLPHISVVRHEEPIGGFRFGISQSGQILHFSDKYIQSPIEEVILLRELFPLILHNSLGDARVWVLALFWAWCESHSWEQSKKVMIEIKQQIGQDPVSVKAIEWADRVLIPHISKQPQNSENIAEYFLDLGLAACKTKWFDDLKLWPVLILWIMKAGPSEALNLKRLKNITTAIQTGTGINYIGIWIYVANYIGETIFQLSDLLRTYQINADSWHSSQRFFFIHLAGAYLLRAVEFLKWDDQPALSHLALPEKLALPVTPGEYAKIMHQLQLTEFLNFIPEPIKQSLSEELRALIIGVFLKRCLKSNFSKELLLTDLAGTLVDIAIENIGDWILYDVVFSLDVTPPGRFSSSIINAPSSSVFDKKAAFQIKLFPLKSGSGQLKIRWTYRDILDPTKKESVVLGLITINCNIDEKGA